MNTAVKWRVFDALFLKMEGYHPFSHTSLLVSTLHIPNDLLLQAFVSYMIQVTRELLVVELKKKQNICFDSFESYCYFKVESTWKKRHFENVRH